MNRFSRVLPAVDLISLCKTVARVVLIAGAVAVGSGAPRDAPVVAQTPQISAGQLKGRTPEQRKQAMEQMKKRGKPAASAPAAKAEEKKVISQFLKAHSRLASTKFPTH